MTIGKRTLSLGLLGAAIALAAVYFAVASPQLTVSPEQPAPNLAGDSTDSLEGESCDSCSLRHERLKKAQD